ncbi:RagB/SusD family nutrient uptake outer membrane protein [Bergeyella porcorum]|uniref:RagB/SusD family nutrient uptake outer membrane protein n=1 Tax=Bergeyella porcorum TaxID=1735111 RepID=A0AAU0F6R7_9FLAO
MNKRIIKTAVLSLGLAFVVASCSEDRLESYVPGVLNEELAVSNSADLATLMNSVYGIVSTRDEAVLTSVLTDEVGIGFANGGQGLNTEWAFTMNPGQSLPGVMWTQNYFALSRINRVINLADKLQPTSTSDANVIANLKAQAYTMRAYCHLRLLAYFTTDLKDDNALAGILANRVFLPSEKNNARNTNAEFYQLIHSDLDTALQLFSESGLAFNSINANSVFANGLKARAYAYKGNYTDAKVYANKVINEAGLTLATPDQYRSLFFSDSQPNNVEVIFKLKRTAAQNAQATNLHNGWVSTVPTYDGSVFYEVGRSLHNILNPNNVSGQLIASQVQDVRANVIIGPTSTISKVDLSTYTTTGDYRNEDVLVINKHGGASTGTTVWAANASNANNNDFKIMRLSEMYLILAEAEAAAGNFAGVASALKSVRDARYGSSQTVTVPTSAQVAYKAVLDERRLEFAFEGYRFIDLKRLGTLANSGIDRHAVDYAARTANYPAANPSNMPLTSHKWALPIPNVELNVNRSIQQNPGY